MLTLIVGKYLYYNILAHVKEIKKSSHLDWIF